MKHIKLFEAFEDMYIIPQSIKDMYEKKGVLLGYYSDGGIGSHPTVVTPEMARAIRDFKDFRIFVPVSVEPSLPQALVCMLDKEGWKIKGVSKNMAETVTNTIGGEHIDSVESGLEEVNKIARMVGFSESQDDFSVIITVIMTPSINTVYWSDAPEQTHSYWQPPYEAIPIEELIDDLKGGFNIGFGEVK